MNDVHENEFNESAFSNHKIIHLEVDILNDLWDALQAEFTENKWGPQDGLRYVLAAGLVYLQAGFLNSDESQEQNIRFKWIDILRKRIAMDGHYAVLKYRAHQLEADVKTKAEKLDAYQKELELLRDTQPELYKKLKEKF